MNKKMEHPVIAGKKVFRDFNVDNGNIDVEKRLVKIAFSSEQPVERFFGNEVLSHEAGAVDMSRLLDGAPLLLNHDTDKQIGVVESASIDNDKVGRAIVRFSRSPEAELIFNDVIDGIRKKISVGYVINEIIEVGKKAADKIETYLATNWTPLELSLVSIPADFKKAGVGRSEENFNEENLENKNIKINERKIKMENEKTNDLPKEDVLKNERDRVNEIEATAKKFVGRVGNIEDLRTSAVRNGWSSEQFKAAVADKLSDGKPFETPIAELGLSQKEKNKYSIRNLILSQVPNTGVRADFERELSAEVVKKTGKAPRGLYMPFDIQTRDILTSGGSGAGSNLVGTQLQPQSFVEFLYNAQIATKLGAQRLSGLSQNVAIPKQSGKSTVGWVTENSATSETNPTFTQVTLSPKTVGAFVDYSRNLLIQSLPSIESLVMQDLATSVGLAVDAAMLHGSGASGQPTGIENTSGIGAVSPTAGALSWANVLDFETDILTANADASKCAYLTTPAINAILKAKAKVSGDSRDFIVGADGKMNGFPVYVSNQVSSGYVFMGNWSDLLIGEFGNGVDILVDPYTGSSAGTYRVVSFYSVDLAARHAGSFSMASGVTS